VAIAGSMAPADAAEPFDVEDFTLDGAYLRTKRMSACLVYCLRMRLIICQLICMITGYRNVDDTEVELPALPQTKEEALALYKASRVPMSSMFSTHCFSTSDAVIMHWFSWSFLADALPCWLNYVARRVLSYCGANDGGTDWYVKVPMHRNRVAKFLRLFRHEQESDPWV
jgi:hypothetical protein